MADLTHVAPRDPENQPIARANENRTIREFET